MPVGATSKTPGHPGVFSCWAQLCTDAYVLFAHNCPRRVPDRCDPVGRRSDERRAVEPDRALRLRVPVGARHRTLCLVLATALHGAQEHLDSNAEDEEVQDHLEHDESRAAWLAGEMSPKPTVAKTVTVKYRVSSARSATLEPRGSGPILRGRRGRTERMSDSRRSTRRA